MGEKSDNFRDHLWSYCITFLQILRIRKTTAPLRTENKKIEEFSGLKNLNHSQITRMSHPMDVQCTACKEIVRKDTLLSHIKKLHPSYLWDNVFCTYQAIDPDNHSLRTKRNIRTAISILEDARIPYELDEDVHVDFGSNVTYSTDKTAIKHITEHPAKHKDNFLELLKEGLTNEKMIQLLQWIAEKPTQVVMDKMIERRLKDELKEQVDSATERIESLKDQYALLQRRYTALNEGEEQQEIQRLKQQVSEYSSEHRKLALMYKELQVELKQYKLTDKELEDKNRNNLMTEQKEWDVYEKMRDDLQKKSEKSVAQHKKEVEKLNAVYDKKESKYKKEIKALKHQIKVLKVKASKPDSDSDLSSGSDSDSE